MPQQNDDSDREAGAENGEMGVWVKHDRVS